MKPRDLTSQPYYGVFVHGKPCDCGKQAFSSRAGAKTVVREMRRRGDRDPQSLNVYRCHIHRDAWHVGHRPWVSANLNDPRLRWVG